MESHPSLVASTVSFELYCLITGGEKRFLRVAYCRPKSWTKPSSAVLAVTLPMMEWDIAVVSAIVDKDGSSSTVDQAKRLISRMVN